MRREYVNSEAHCYKERGSEREKRVVLSNSARRPFISVTFVALFRKQKKKEVADRIPPFARRIKKMGGNGVLGLILINWTKERRGF